MHPPLPLRSPVLVHALYHCAPAVLMETLARSLTVLPTWSGQVWHLSRPTPTSVTLWPSAASTRPPVLTFHLSVRPPAVNLWTTATTPDHLLLCAALLLALDGAVPRFAAARRLPSVGRPTAGPSGRRFPTPVPWPHHGVPGGRP